MRATDLDLRELLDFEPTGGVIRFAGDRALLFNTVALGLLRRELVETLGLVTARGILTRFGYAHGWRTAEVAAAAVRVGLRARVAAGRRPRAPVAGLPHLRAGAPRAGRAAEGVRAGDLARVVRGAGASRAARAVDRAGLLDAGGLRERVSQLRRRSADPLLRGEVRGQGRRVLPHGRTARGGMAELSHVRSALLRSRVPRRGAEGRDRDA